MPRRESLQARPLDRIRDALRARGGNPELAADGRTGTARCRVGPHGKGNGDQNKSLSFGERPDGSGWVKCHAGCTRSDVLSSLDLGPADLLPKRDEARVVVENYPYCDEHGTFLFEVVRFNPKGFRQRHRDANGQWEWNLQGVRRVLYRLPAVLAAAKAGRAIYVVEGEKDVHAADRAGAVATTCPMGAGKWRAEYSEFLRGAIVIIVADCDKPGADHARSVAAALEGIAASIRIVEAAVGKDLYDHIAAGKTLDELVPWAKDVVLIPSVVPQVPQASARTQNDQWPAPLDPLAMHGPAGEFVRLVAPHSEADEAALLVQFLVGVGNAIGRGPHYRVEGDDHYTNLFAVLVGTTSHGRKGTSWGRVRQLLQEVDSEWASEHVQSGLSSGEGLIWAVRDPIRKLEHRRGQKGSPGSYEDVVTDPGVKDKRSLVLESEFASVLRVLQRDGNTLSAIVRNAWDGREVLQSLTKNSPAKATNAHVAILGHITRDEALRYLDRTELANGFANRFLWVGVRRSKQLPEGGDLSAVALAPLIDTLGKRVGAARHLGPVTFDEAARRLWHAAYPVLSGDRPGLFGAVTARAEAQCLRLALVYAVLDGGQLIRVEHLRAAFGLWSYCEDSARFVFGVSLGEPMADEILRMLRARPEGMTRTDIRDAFHRNRSGNEIGRALEVLLGHGLAAPMAVPTGGRPGEHWLATPTTETSETTKGSGGGGLRSFRSFLSSLDLDDLPPVPPRSSDLTNASASFSLPTPSEALAPEAGPVPVDDGRGASALRTASPAPEAVDGLLERIAAARTASNAAQEAEARTELEADVGSNIAAELERDVLPEMLAERSPPETVPPLPLDAECIASEGEVSDD
jgi:5S rRNA maturation endonuclease (ribonuclease M5)